MEALELKSSPSVVGTNPDNSQFVPIGEVEETLDKLYSYWGSENFRFKVYNIFDKTFASGSVTLLTKPENGDVQRMEGAGTVQVFPDDTNTHYEATVLSYCIANAALRKGIVFGRGLNGRLQRGENSLPVIQMSLEKASKELEEDVEATKKRMIKAKTKDEAERIMNENGFKYHVILKEVLKNKK